MCSAPVEVHASSTEHAQVWPRQLLIGQGVERSIQIELASWAAEVDIDVVGTQALEQARDAPAMKLVHAEVRVGFPAEAIQQIGNLSVGLFRLNLVPDVASFSFFPNDHRPALVCMDEAEMLVWHREIEGLLIRPLCC